jgi:hypothetical protein
MFALITPVGRRRHPKPKRSGHFVRCHIGFSNTNMTDTMSCSQGTLRRGSRFPQSSGETKNMHLKKSAINRVMIEHKNKISLTPSGVAHSLSRSLAASSPLNNAADNTCAISTWAWALTCASGQKRTATKETIHLAPGLPTSSTELPVGAVSRRSGRTRRVA